MPTLLKFVDKANAILRQIMPEITDFKDPALHSIINDMCFSILPQQLVAAQALYKSAAGVAANQWGIEKRIFIFSPNGSEKHAELEVIMNPAYVPCLSVDEETPKLIAGYEGCFSVPLTVGKVNRYEKIMATYYNIQREKVELMMEGWRARVFQHETDHLNGKLFDGRLDHYAGLAFKDSIYLATLLPCFY